MLCIYRVGHFLYVLNAGLQQQNENEKQSQQQQQQQTDQVTIKPTLLTVRRLRRHVKKLLFKLKKWSLRKLCKNNKNSF